MTQQPEKNYAPNEHIYKHEIDDRLVSNLRNCLGGATEIPIRGVYYGSASGFTWEDYFINRISNMPSCIVECGFATNPQDNAIFDASYKLLAAAIVKALMQTIGVEMVGQFSVSESPSIQKSGDNLYYVLDGKVVWDFSDTFTYNQTKYIVKNGIAINTSSGVFGNFLWEIDDDDLIITGDGAMPDFDDSDTVPYKNECQNAVIKGKTTSVGKNAFRNFTNLNSVAFAGTITSIGENAFLGCDNIKDVYYYGLKNDWEKVTIATGNDVIKNAKVHFICDIEGHSYEFSCSEKCSVCGESKTTTHTYLFECDSECRICKEPRANTHIYSGVCDKRCNYCNKWRETTVEHIFDENGKCVGCGRNKIIPGDVNDDEIITDADAIYLLYYTFFPEDYPIEQDCDYNGDGMVTDADAIYILYYTFFPEDYPLVLK